MKKLQLLTLMVFAALTACQKEPSTSMLDDEVFVYTAHDRKADFKTVESYFLPDSILLMGRGEKSHYWKEGDAAQIIAEVAGEMNNAGYVRTTEKGAADVGLQLSYIEQVTYYIGSTNPNWWWYYPYYWSPDYWGNWNGWNFPYWVEYGYAAGTLLIEMVSLDSEPAPDRKLSVVWDAFISGLLSSSSRLNLERTTEGIDQAFEQSPYLNKSQR